MAIYALEMYALDTAACIYMFGIMVVSPETVCHFEINVQFCNRFILVRL